MCRDGRLTPLIYSLFPVHCISQNDHRSNTLKNCSFMDHQGCIIIDHWIVLSTQNLKKYFGTSVFLLLVFQRKILRGNYNIEHEAFSGISRQAKDLVSRWRMKLGQIKSFPGALSLYLYLYIIGAFSFGGGPSWTSFSPPVSWPYVSIPTTINDHWPHDDRNIDFFYSE